MRLNHFKKIDEIIAYLKLKNIIYISDIRDSESVYKITPIFVFLIENNCKLLHEKNCEGSPEDIVKKAIILSLLAIDKDNFSNLSLLTSTIWSFSQ